METTTYRTSNPVMHYWGMVKDIESLRNENIDQYSNKKNQSNYDYVDTDSIAEVIEDFGY